MGGGDTLDAGGIRVKTCTDATNIPGSCGGDPLFDEGTTAPGGFSFDFNVQMDEGVIYLFELHVNASATAGGTVAGDSGSGTLNATVTFGQ